MNYDFTIVTPSFNQAKYLEKTILSVINQKGNFTLQYIIADGGSADNSVKIIKKYASLLKSPKYKSKCKGIDLIWWSNKDKGQSDAINQGFKLAKGKYVAWINSDDYYIDDAFLKVKNKFKDEPKASFIYGNFIEIDEKGNTLRKIEAEKKFSIERLINSGNYIGQPATFFRREALIKAGYLNPKYHYAMDYDLWIKLGKISNAYPLSSDLATFRLHSDSKTVSLYDKFWREVWIISRSHGGKFFSDIFFYNKRAQKLKEKNHYYKNKFPKFTSKMSKLGRAVKIIFSLNFSLLVKKINLNLKRIKDKNIYLSKISKALDLKVEKINAILGITIKLEKNIPRLPSIGIALLVQDRPEYLKYSLDSLLKTKIDNFKLTILLHDDGSTDKEAIKMFNNAKSKNIKIIKYRKKTSSGSWGGAFNSAIKNLLKKGNFDVIGTADSDAYFHPDWLIKTIEIARYAKKNYKGHILGPFSSFNSSDKEFHEIINIGKTPYGDFVVKKRMGALNYMYCLSDFIKLGNFEENRDDETLMTIKFNKLRVRNFSTLESYVEHLGEESILNKSRPVPVTNAVHALNLIKDGWPIDPNEVKRRIKKEINKK
jgi:glycosyltransferase involved in cell wall biosynthesis